MTRIIDLDGHRRGTPGPQRREPVDDTDRAVYTVAETAQLLSLSLGSTYALIRAGEIPAHRVGGRWVISKARFHSWLDANTVEPLDRDHPDKEPHP